VEVIALIDLHRIYHMRFLNCRTERCVSRPLGVDAEVISCIVALDRVALTCTLFREIATVLIKKDAVASTVAGTDCKQVLIEVSTDARS
jgi:hypothetical protein